jgi:hypothetical protein
MIHLWPDADLVEITESQAKQNSKPSDFWEPQPKQRLLLDTAGLLDALDGGPVRAPACELIGYGGAAFGGKTEGLIGIGLIACMSIPGVQVGYFRRMFTELEGPDGPISRSQQIYRAAGGKYNSQKHTWKFAGIGSSLHFCNCQNESNVYSYQSQAFDILLIDEATHFSWFIVDYLLTRNRASKYSKAPGPFCVMCTNPGGIGHNWFMQLFGIDPDGYHPAND